MSAETVTISGEASPTLLDAFAAAGLSPEGRRRAEEAHRESGESLPVIISRLGLLNDEAALGVLSEVYGLDIIDDTAIPDVRVHPDLNPAFLKSRRILPLGETETEIVIALVDPASSDAVSGVRFAAGKSVTTRLIGFDSWRRAFARLYGGTEEEVSASGPAGRGARWTDDASGLRDLALDAPAVQLIESLIAEASDAHASDIHIERKPDGGLVRLRIDGRLQDHKRVSGALADRAVARLKVLGDLDVSDHRRAQDGRTALSARGKPIDVRLSIIPSAYGEGAVIRLLHRGDIRLDFTALGFSSAEEGRIRSAISRPQGFYLVAGPTGGGKTTTLYAALNALRSPDRKIVTVEDPIEYFFEDIHQTGIDERAGLSFASALRAFLRHDPDIVLVGEIRDPDTAKTAVQAALTGHMVLSTLHAASAAGVPARLIEMGVEPYLIASTLTAASAQRLVRRLCPSCRRPAERPDALIVRAGIDLDEDALFFGPGEGCEACSGGYLGRLVISETLTIGEEERDLLKSSASLDAWQGRIETPMLADGLIKAGEGLTSVDEVLRALETI